MDYKVSQVGTALNSWAAIDRMCKDGVIRAIPFLPGSLVLSADQMPVSDAQLIIEPIEDQDGHTYGVTEEKAAPKKKAGKE